MEVDLVYHCGEQTRGDYCHTLTGVDITTGWAELRVLRNRARLWTVQALDDINRSVPFALHTWHSDNGPEFLNGHLVAYAEARGIKLTRSRAYHKNDSPYVESRQWTLVRSYVGYRRYNTDREYEILAELMPLISVVHNYFIPTLKTIAKERVGGKVRRRRDLDTPFNRVLAAAEVSPEDKERIKRIRANLSYFSLLNRIQSLQVALDRAYREKYSVKLEVS